MPSVRRPRSGRAPPRPRRPGRPRATVADQRSSRLACGHPAPRRRPGRRTGGRPRRTRDAVAGRRRGGARPCPAARRTSGRRRTGARRARPSTSARRPRTRRTSGRPASPAPASRVGACPARGTRPAHAVAQGRLEQASTTSASTVVGVVGQVDAGVERAHRAPNVSITTESRRDGSRARAGRGRAGPRGCGRQDGSWGEVMAPSPVPADRPPATRSAGAPGRRSRCGRKRRAAWGCAAGAVSGRPGPRPSAAPGAMRACVRRRRSSTSTSTRSSRPSSSATSRRCAASRSSSAASGAAAWSPPRPTRRASSASARRCRPARRGRRCPHAAFLTGRFHAYRDTSERVMALLRALSPLVEPLSLDEAFVDLAHADLPDLEVPTVSALRPGPPPPGAARPPAG